MMIQGIADHLWQSTWFCGVAFLLTLMLRPNGARPRYWIWFAASVKFLIPFSLLVSLGTHMYHRVAAPPIEAGWVAVFQEFGQPLTLARVTAPAAVSARPLDHVDFAVAGVVLWACGFLAVLFCWFLRWRRIHAVRNSACSVNITTSLPIPVPVMSAPDLIEPGIIGILRPVLLLPEGIADKLSQPQLDAILAHEFCHVERRDNLKAAIHMIVQSIFWFHPLTWWIGTRLVAERERACDEEVLRRGCSANVYAESILAVCRLYLSTPLACVSGVTGSNLKKRIEAIMKHRSVIGLNFGKKIVLVSAGLVALMAPIITGVLNAPPAQAQDTSDWQTKAGGKMAFDVASVKLSEGAFVPPSMPLDAGDRYSPAGGYFQADFPLWTYIQFAYKLWAPTDDQQAEIARAPKWIKTDRYRIEARVAGTPAKDQFRLMVQSLLADRFKLATHFDTREGAALALTLVKPGQLGPKLIPHANGRACGDAAAPIGPVPANLIGGKDDAGPGNFPPMCDSLAVIRKSGGALMIAGYRNASMEMLAGSLAGITGRGRPLVDKTGLTGRFDFTIEWAPETSNSPQSDAPAVAPDPLGPAPSEALRDQLGLKLEPVRAPVKILVIDKVEKPSQN